MFVVLFPTTTTTVLVLLYLKGVRDEKPKTCTSYYWCRCVPASVYRAYYTDWPCMVSIMDPSSNTSGKHGSPQDTRRISIISIYRLQQRCMTDVFHHSPRLTDFHRTLHTLTLTQSPSCFRREKNMTKEKFQQRKIFIVNWGL